MRIMTSLLLLGLTLLPGKAWNRRREYFMIKIMAVLIQKIKGELKYGFKG
jgi:hypothetical protein